VIVGECGGVCETVTISENLEGSGLPVVGKSGNNLRFTVWAREDEYRLR
jgi:hypothetical protein